MAALTTDLNAMNSFEDEDSMDQALLTPAENAEIWEPEARNAEAA